MVICDGRQIRYIPGTTTTASPEIIHTTKNTTGSGESGKPGLGGGAIAGIVIGCLVGAAILAVLIVFGIWRCRKRYDFCFVSL